MSRRGTNIRKRADGRWEGRYYIPEINQARRSASQYTATATRRPATS